MLPAILLVSCGLADSEYDERIRYEYVVFSDKAFERFCLEQYDFDGNGRISRYEAQRVRRMDCSGRGIGSLLDIGEFTGLERLDCSCNELDAFDATNLGRLERLDCSHNRLTRLAVDGLPNLTELDCSYNRIERLEMGSSFSLCRLEAGHNCFPTLDLRGCALSLTADLRGNSYLTMVYIRSGQQVTVDGDAQLVVEDRQLFQGGM